MKQKYEAPKLEALIAEMPEFMAGSTKREGSLDNGDGEDPTIIPVTDDDDEEPDEKGTFSKEGFEGWNAWE